MENDVFPYEFINIGILYVGMRYFQQFCKIVGGYK